MIVNECRPYHARVVDQCLVRLDDGLSVYKLYFISIVGREQPRRYEWEHAPFTTADFLERFAEASDSGVGFVTAFPHITKVFRFAPDAETLLHVRAMATEDFSRLDLGRAQGYVEFACYAEAAVAADEYHAWARADSVADYLAYWSEVKDAPVISAGKLRAYWSE